MHDQNLNFNIILNHILQQEQVFKWNPFLHRYSFQIYSQCKSTRKPSSTNLKLISNLFPQWAHQIKPTNTKKIYNFFFFKWTKIKAWNFNSMQASWYTNNKQKSIKTQKPNCVSNSSKTHYIFQINNKKSYQSLACQYSKLGLNDHLKKDPETELEKEENHTHLTETQKGKE